MSFSLESHEMITLYTRSREGHRGAYVDFVCENIGANIEHSFIKLATVKGTTFFLMIEDNFFAYSIVSIVRALMGKKSIGLLFRPKPALSRSSVRLCIKNLILKILKKVPLVNTLTIVPHYVDEKFSSISDGWIYDFQFWDLINTGEAQRKFSDGERGLISEAISAASKGRKVVSAIGSQNSAKGFDDFTNLYLSHPRLREKILFAYAGKVDSSLISSARRFETYGFGVNRYIGDHEVFEVYSSSDAIWSYYSNSYDQASGIAGRAMQFGIPPIVRAGSAMDIICKTEGNPHISINSPEEILNIDIPSRDQNAALIISERMKSYSIDKIYTIIQGINI